MSAQGTGAPGTRLYNTTLSGEGLFRKITRVTAAYQVLVTDDQINCTAAAAMNVTLPPTPNDGDEYTVKDVGGTGATRNLTIVGNGHNIDGAATLVINTNYGKATVSYDATAGVWAQTS